jgi:thiol-disulfide isomerase/thioredoxin
MHTLRLIVILLTISYLPARAAVLTGKVTNAKPGDRIELFVPHLYVDGRNDTYQASLGEQLTFSIEAPIPEPQIAFLIYNYNRLPIFIEPDDNLYIGADALQFHIPVEYGGRGGANNCVLQQYFKENTPDYDETNNVRFKIGHWWAAVERPIYERMAQLDPAALRKTLDDQKAAFIKIYDDFSDKNPAALTPAFYDWYFAEVTYWWAYHLMFYGNAHAGNRPIQPEFFDFLYEAPNFSKAIGNDWYRQFLHAIVAWQLAKDQQVDNYFAGQYALAGEMLRDKPLAYFRSEMVLQAFKEEHYREILPFYADFIKSNRHPAFEAKVTDLYEKAVRVSPGAPAPMFTAGDLKGNLVSLEQMHGRVVYLNFWASWCGACVEKMKIFDKYAAELNRLGIEIVNVSVDENPLKWQTSVTERGFKGRNLLASSGNERNIATAYGVETVPQYFIIHKNGTFADKAPVNQPEAIKNKLINLAESY